MTLPQALPVAQHDRFRGERRVLFAKAEEIQAFKRVCTTCRDLYDCTQRVTPGTR